MVTLSWKVWGIDGHRQRQSFGASETLDFRFCAYARPVVIAVEREDITGTNDFVVIRITAETEAAARSEFNSQLSDGIFENCRVGRIEEMGEGF